MNGANEMSTLLEMKEITKTFGKVVALNQVNLKIKQQEIHAIVGENGAGKSTLMKVLSGVYPYGTYEGDIVHKEEVISFKNIKDSEKEGIVIIHQELALIPYLSIAENIFLGNEQANSGIIDWNKTYQKTVQLLKKVGLNENPNTIVGDIGIGKQQLVEIAKALSKKVELLILDEPTAALNEVESENLLKLLLELKTAGISSVIISHKLNEVLYVSDQITVIRDGQTIDSFPNIKGEVDEDRIIRGMVGREMEDRYPKRDTKIGDILFEVKDWNVYHPDNKNKKVISDINFHVKEGEVIGIAGLMGAGRTELAMSLFGKAYGSKTEGTVLKKGKQLSLKNIPHAISEGLAYVTEDRKKYGLVLEDDINRNTSLANLKAVSHNGVVDENKERKVAESFRQKMRTKSSSIFQLTKNLSGGNQQKVVLSKWLLTNPDVLILDEPTRGIDVGAKYEIYQIINELVADGKCVIVISSELPEVIGLSDRIYVMNEGKFVGEVLQEGATQERIMSFIVEH